MEKLMQHTWPGNVRELENVLERAFVTANSNVLQDIIIPEPALHAPNHPLNYVFEAKLPYAAAKSLLLQEFEKKYFLTALEQCNYNVNETARKTGVNPRTLWRKISCYGLKPSSPGPEQEE